MLSFLHCTAGSHLLSILYIVVFQTFSRIQWFVTPWTAAIQASLSPPPGVCSKLMSTESVTPSSHLSCVPLLPLSSILPSIRGSSMCRSAPVSQLSHPLSLLLGTHKLILYVCVSISALPPPRIMKIKTKINKST